MAEIRQKIVRCPNCSRYYDVSASQVCPYCSPSQDQPLKESPFAGSTISASDSGVGADKVGVTTDGGSAQTNHSAHMEKTQYVVDTYTNEGVPEPVVGWLVAISGPCTGMDFRLHAGYNDIGREKGDIRIKGDNTISGEHDATVAYVADTNKFYIAHVQGKNVLSVNRMPVMGGNTELNKGDIITIGKTELIFVPFCGEKFTWKEGMIGD